LKVRKYLEYKDKALGSEFWSVSSAPNDLPLMEIWCSVNIYGLGGYRNLSITITRDEGSSTYAEECL